jgi:uncharacterized membrane protein
VLEDGSHTSFANLMDGVAKAFEIVGVAILIIGVLWSGWIAAVTWRRTRRGNAAYLTLRRTFGSTLLLGLEVLVAADLIRTVAVSPTVGNVLVLGLIVLIRTFLSFSLQIEIDGRLPWRRSVPADAEAAPGDHAKHVPTEPEQPEV